MRKVFILNDACKVDYFILSIMLAAPLSPDYFFAMKRHNFLDFSFIQLNQLHD